MKKRAAKPIAAFAAIAFVLAAVTAEAASAEESRSRSSDRRAESIVVEPKVVPEPPPRVRPDYGFDVDIWTDRRTYEIGDLVRIYFRVTRPCYVYIFNTDTQGVTRQLFPNYYDQDSFCVPGRRYYIPDADYKLRVIGPPGTEQLRIVAVRYRPAYYENRHRYSPRDPFPTYREGAKGFLREYQQERRGGDERRSRSRSRDAVQPRVQQSRGTDALERSRREIASKRPETIVVEPNRPRTIVVEDPDVTVTYDRDYAEAYTTFRVATPYPRPRADYDGRLSVTSTPSGARVEVDGRYRGRTPETIDYLAPGVHEVEVTLTGFATWRGEVNVHEGRSTSVHVRLRPHPPRPPFFHFDFRF